MYLKLQDSNKVPTDQLDAIAYNGKRFTMKQSRERRAEGDLENGVDREKSVWWS